MPSWLSIVLTMWAGGGVTMLSSWLTDRRSLARERERLTAERMDRSRSLRNDFQRETLLALQDEIQQLMRTTSQIHHHDKIHFSKTGKWERTPVADDIDQNHIKAITQILLHGSRVRDKNIRNLTDRFRNECSLVVTSVLPEASEDFIRVMGNLHMEIISSIGRLIRELDDAS